MITLEPYRDCDAQLWDEFVKTSKNGTFLHLRSFMDYHADRFTDCSLLFYRKQKLIAVLPANRDGNIFYSHQGLTYGALVMGNEIKTQDVIHIFSLLLSHLKTQKITDIYYKVIPYIYHIIPSEEDIYALFVSKFNLFSRGISSCGGFDELASYTVEKKRSLKKAKQHNLEVKETDQYSEFWSILSHNLKTRYGKSPVHTLDEIRHLVSLFPNNIKLYGVFQEGCLIAGAVLFITDRVVHLQYVATSSVGRELLAVDLLIDWVLNNNWEGKVYFDYGISTEENGMILNEPLIHHKEGFGLRGITYDIYHLKLE